ncbi:hypothetical protein M878_15840 [Streptomyces roseochromogenus subsp. oscitans DS 12.976]|uniref:Uncharacterized protein n=1 Tax=Streptomyces roseochromogenus subsp. oscitans DS 12.976 TaxID=1352936 RepID=V6KIH8_STRRC|nr:hypothetical protein M878_15840 [Streptomyces roseochromogenus subsp. oscitans DS 12.976]
MPVVRRGRHRKPRPRKLLLAAGGLAVAAGVLSLVRVTPDPGSGSPGAAEAEPRLGASDNHATNTAATTPTAAPTALPSATSAMGGRSLVPTTTGRPGTGTEPGTPSSRTATPTALPSAPASAPGTNPRPSDPTSAAPPTTTRPTPTTPAPSHSTTPPDPGGLCVPMLGICVSLPGGTGH